MPCCASGAGGSSLAAGEEVLGLLELPPADSAALGLRVAVVADRAQNRSQLGPDRKGRATRVCQRAHTAISSSSHKQDSLPIPIQRGAES